MKFTASNIPVGPEALLPKAKGDAIRLFKMQAMKKQGANYSQIAKTMGISAQAVRQLLLIHPPMPELEIVDELLTQSLLNKGKISLLLERAARDIIAMESFIYHHLKINIEE